MERSEMGNRIMEGLGRIEKYFFILKEEVEFLREENKDLKAKCQNE